MQLQANVNTRLQIKKELAITATHGLAFGCQEVVVDWQKGNNLNNMKHL